VLRSVDQVFSELLIESKLKGPLKVNAAYIPDAESDYRYCIITSKYTFIQAILELDTLLSFSYYELLIAVISSQLL